MLALDMHAIALMGVAFALCGAVEAQPADNLPPEEQWPDHLQSAKQNADQEAASIEEPPLPEGMDLSDVLEYSSHPPPDDFPDPVPDGRIYRFTFIEQLEYRVATGDAANLFGWEAQGWIGGDFNRFWWKSEGETEFAGTDQGESENDFLYSRLISPFWNLQGGVQYANEWADGNYEDRWSAVVAFQGLAPYKIELDNSIFLSEDGDLTATVEGEYGLRITQRLVLQPRAELGVSAQDIEERRIGSGLTDISLDMRLRYEFQRELAPYLLVRYISLLGETADIIESDGEDTDQWFFGAGLRLAF